MFSYLWCIWGDFNEVRNIGKRNGCVRRDRGMRDFNDFIECLEVVDLPLLGRKFTWGESQKGDKWSRLDRFLLHYEWVEKFDSKQWGLPRALSNHSPILLMKDEKDWGSSSV